MSVLGAVQEGSKFFEQIDWKAGLTGGTPADPPEIKLDGIYDGDNTKLTFEFSVPGGGTNEGEVGITENLSLSVYNEDGERVKIINVGLNYAEGDRVEIADGLAITISAGTVTHGDSFTIDARSDADTSGFLVAAGMNTFFYGNGAYDIDIREEFYDNPHLIASAVGPDGFDGYNIKRMAEVGQTRLSDLANSTIADFHRDMIADIGQQTMIRQSRVEASEAVMNQLANQRDKASGVDPNEEAAKLIMYERMFQSMSKLIQTQDNALQELMNLL
jgi:flagellar hook-associated protein FlgK